MTIAIILLLMCVLHRKQFGSVVGRKGVGVGSGRCLQREPRDTEWELDDEGGRADLVSKG